MSQVRDLFFDEFYDELERVTSGIAPEDSTSKPSVLSDEVRRCWIPYIPDPDKRSEALISVDGGVQTSRFAYGDFVAVGRAMALIHRPGQDMVMEKRVKIHIQKVYDDRDRGFIPGYVRLIAEYETARAAAERVLEEGGRPLVLLDGSLYLSRFPYAIREYVDHPELLAELFNSISTLRCMGRDRGFPVVAVSKDSAVFYLYMRLLKDAVRRADLGPISEEVERSSSPLDLRIMVKRWPEEKKEALRPFVEQSPLCDTALIGATTDVEGYTRPLLLAPSIYYGRSDAPAFYDRIRSYLGGEEAHNVIGSLTGFFDCPGVAVTYWKPTRDGRPFRVDISASELGYDEPWGAKEGDRLIGEDRDLNPLEGVLNHLGFWFCNDVEYNIPMRQTDILARFDRNLYASKYEPFIVRRLEQAGLDVRATRRVLREAAP